MSRRTFLAIIIMALLFSFCATEPEPLDRTQPEAVNKAIFNGEWIYKATVTDTDWDNKFTFIGEETSSYMGDAFKLRWEITMDYLNAYKVAQRYMTLDGRLVENDAGDKSLVLSFRIKKHYDIRYRYNSTTREDLNVIEENYDRPWNEREYMEVDWSQNLATNVSNPLQMDLASGDLVREPVSVYENVEFFARGATKDEDYKIDTRKWNPKTDPEVYVINIDLKESIRSRLESWIQLYYGEYMPPVTVKTRHSLMKALPIDKQTYKPMQYDDYFFRRFGFFRTEYDTYDPERGPMENQKQYLINRWDFSNGKKLIWYASPSFQEQINEGDSDLKGYALKVIEEWNKVVKEALGRTDDVIEFRENEPLCNEGVKVITNSDGIKVCEDGKQVTNLDGSKRWKYELGDLRYSFLNFIKKPQNASPLGYGPSTPDADTGEIVSATVNVYGNWVDYVVRRAMDQYDVAAGLCTLDNVKDGLFYNPETGKCDSPIFIGKYKGGVVQPKAAPQVENNKKNTNRLRTLTPALKTAYFPKFDIHKPDPQISQEQMKKDLEKLKILYKEQLKNPVVLDLNGFKSIKGTKFESMLVPHSTYKSLLPYAKSADDAEVVALLSPARRLSPEFLYAMKNGQKKRMHYCDEPIMFEPAIHAFVDEMKDKPRDEVYKILRNWIWYTTALHEMGHTLGLRHNFRGSVDQRNFSQEYFAAYDEYWKQIDAIRAKYWDKIKNGDPDAYEAYVQEIDDIKSIHNRYASTSIMDYLGDWTKWQYPVGSYDRAAILFGYGKKVEVSDGKGGWVVTDYKEGDFRQKDFYDENELAESGRKVRYYMFCSDEKVFDDAFCTRFDVGTTATEIVRNFIRDSQPSYFFKNFKRHSAMFDERRDSYYINKWLWTYYTYGKALGEMTLGSMRYDEMWGSIFDGIDAINKGPETRDMIPGYHRNGGEDLLRATMIFYYYLIYDILMRPDYGYYQLTYDTSHQKYWESTEQQYLDDSKPSTYVPAGIGWGWNDMYDMQMDINQYYPHLERIGVELDKIIALEILSIPAALNEPLYFEKANGVNFWNSLWTNNGSQLWEVIKGLITDNFSHYQNPWCIKCDAACRADPVNHPPEIKTYPVDLLEGMRKGRLISGWVEPTRPNRCGSDDEFPMMPGMDALYAIYPIFYAIAGASHPWYHNSLSDYLDSQVVGGAHRFDPPPGAKTVTMVNSSGTKTYLAAQTSDNLSISYQLVSNGRWINNHLAYYTACINDEVPSEELRTEMNKNCNDWDSCCLDVLSDCYNPFSRTRPEYCDAEGWDTLFMYDGFKYRNLDRIEAMLMMMQDMIDIAGHYAWRVPGFLEEP